MWSSTIGVSTASLPWWRHQMETFSALLALCAGNSPVPVNSPHKGQWRGSLMFSFICVWINGWVNNREAGDLRRYRAHYDVTVMTESNGIANNDIPLCRYMLQQWTELPIQHTTYLHLSFTPSLSLSHSLTRIISHTLFCPFSMYILPPPPPPPPPLCTFLPHSLSLSLCLLVYSFISTSDTGVKPDSFAHICVYCDM